MSPHIFASAYAGLDEAEKTFEWLGRAFDERSSPMVWLKLDPRFDSLRADSRFDDLLRRMGLSS